MVPYAVSIFNAWSTGNGTMDFQYAGWPALSVAPARPRAMPDAYV